VSDWEVRMSERARVRGHCVRAEFLAELPPLYADDRRIRFIHYDGDARTTMINGKTYRIVEMPELGPEQ
jgi:hypothetical protein